MYTKNNQMISNKETLSNYIEGLDLFNSQFLYMIADPTLERKIYEITVFEYRPDLIAKEFYGSENYMGILMAQIGTGLSGLKRGNKISLLPLNVISSILNSL